MEQVCEGLQYAHEHRLVHRDIKPANLFLENSGRARGARFRHGAGGGIGADQGRRGGRHGELHGARADPWRAVHGRRRTSSPRASCSSNSPRGGIRSRARTSSLAQVVSAIVFEAAAEALATLSRRAGRTRVPAEQGAGKGSGEAVPNAGELKQAIAVCRLAMAHGAAAPAASEPVAEKTKVFEKSARRACARRRRKDPGVRAARSGDCRCRRPSPPRRRRPHPRRPRRAETVRRGCDFATARPARRRIRRTRWRAADAGRVLAEGGAAAAKSTNWGMYIAIGVAAVLAVVLIVVLMTKR